MSSSSALPTQTPHTDDAHAPRGLAHHLVKVLSDDISEGRLHAGDRLPTEPMLVARFGVSRTVVREAMSRLQTAGWVSTRHGVGTFVLATPPQPAAALGTPSSEPPSLADKLAMLELRISVESDAAALAAQRRTPAQLEKLKELLDAFATALAAGHATVGHDARFHLQIAEATGNKHFEEVLRTLGRATIPREAAGLLPSTTEMARSAGTGAAAAGGAGAGAAEATLPLTRRKALVLDEHRAIYDAIRRGDAQAARAAMFMHLDQSGQRLRALAGLSL
jgi:GntR family transcriptional repressor for pyruvate dehydrogenase complex